MADYRNHVRFNLKCRLLSLKGHKATGILQRAQKQLLNERIQQVHFTLDVLKQKDKQLHQNLAMKLPEDILQKAADFVQQAQLAQHTTIKERQIKKFYS